MTRCVRCTGCSTVETDFKSVCRTLLRTYDRNTCSFTRLADVVQHHVAGRLTGSTDVFRLLKTSEIRCGTPPSEGEIRGSTERCRELRTAAAAEIYQKREQAHLQGFQQTQACRMGRQRPWSCPGACGIAWSRCVVPQLPSRRAISSTGWSCLTATPQFANAVQ